MVEPPTATFPPVYVFVYGTLRRSEDFPMHDLLLPAVFIGYGSFRGKLYDVGTYPAAVLSDTDETWVHGEVYQLQDPAVTLQRLDAYEGCTPDDPVPHEYARVFVSVLMEDGKSLSAHVYLYQRTIQRLTLVSSGDYLVWRSQRLRPGR